MNKVCIITGASGGLGQALVQEFLQQGYIVVGASRHLSGEEKKNNRVHYSIADITKKEDIESILKKAEELGTLQGIINNAGIASWGGIQERDIGIEKKVFEVNLFAPLEIWKISEKILEKNSGFFINIGSISGELPVPFLASYSASKSALEKIFLALLGEKEKTNIYFLHLNLGPLSRGIHFQDIVPKTKREASLQKQMLSVYKNHAYPVEKVAQYITKFILSGRKREFITLGTWSKTVVFLGKVFPKLSFQKSLGKLYKKFV